jgi:hypothetical protein
MKSLKRIMALAVILVGIFSFSKREAETVKSSLNLEGINVREMLSKQQFECRPTSDFMFYVEANLVEKVRGANNINAKVYLLNKVSGQKKLLASENVQINKFKGAIAIQSHKTDKEFKTFVLGNGDKIIGGSVKTTFSFDELIKYEAIYNSYIKSTNKLLKLERTI